MRLVSEEMEQLVRVARFMRHSDFTWEFRLRRSET